MKPVPLIVLYDDWCNMCSVLVKWLSFVNKKKRLVFVTQQDFGKLFPNQTQVIEHLKMVDELVVIRNGLFYTGAKAVLVILGTLGGGYNLAKALLQLFPQAMLDMTYAWVARHRYWFLGRRKSCQIRSPLP